MSRLIQGIDSDDLLDPATHIPPFGCLHPERKQLLYTTMTTIHRSLAIYGMITDLMQDQPIDSNQLDPIILGHIHTRTFGSIPGFRMVLRQLEEAMIFCGQCGQQRYGAVSQASKPIADIFMISHRRKRIGGNRGNPSRKAIPDEDEILEVEEVDSEDEGSPIKTTESLTKPQTIPKVHRVSIPAFQLIHLTSQVSMRRFDLTYDDYDTGPTAENSFQMHYELLSYFKNQPENFKWTSMMLRFRDHGYRILPSSFDQFYLSLPSIVDQLIHFFPTPLPDDIARWKDQITTDTVAEDPPSIDEQGPLSHSCIAGTDMVEWGLQEMVSNVGPERSPSSTKAYITGRTNTEGGEDSYIWLNIMKDRVQPEDVSISIDIDSVIWLTRRLKVKAAFNLHTSPYRKEQPPISTANHTYIELLWPRLNDDVVNGRISDGVKQVPLSNLPNTHFATFGRVEGSPNITIVFPRMKHRYPLRNYWETRLPDEIGLLWLENVVYVALHRLDGVGIRPYVDFSYEDTKWKHAGTPETTQVLAPEHLEQLQDHIDIILDEHRGDHYYDCFQSYFFVLEMKGIKVSTSSDDLKSKEPWISLVNNYPAFDWEYMENTDNGELLIDVGFGFHPSGEVPVVGFWHMETLRLGFNYGGYNQGTHHGVCTIPTVGGIQAEMSKARRLMIHIAYRQSYNLAYEAIRGKLTRERGAFFSAGSAYHQKSDYQKQVEGISAVFMRNITRSYGVRDEYRCRATTRRLFPVLINKVVTLHTLYTV